MEGKMEKKKNFVVIGGLVMLLIAFFLLVGSFGGCQPNRFRAGDSEPAFCERGFHPRFMHKKIPERVLARMDKRVEALSLTEIQKQKYEVLRLEIRDNLLEGMEKRKTLLKEIKNEMQKDTPDVNAIAEVLRERVRGLPGFIEENMDLLLDFYNILDEDQQSKVLKRL
jgi:hypothetical protein